MVLSFFPSLFLECKLWHLNVICPKLLFFITSKRFLVFRIEGPVLDETQRVNNRGKVRHDALKNHLDPDAFLLLPGTLA